MELCKETLANKITAMSTEIIPIKNRKTPKSFNELLALTSISIIACMTRKSID